MPDCSEIDPALERRASGNHVACLLHTGPTTHG
jgi:hypothetical protein